MTEQKRLSDRVGLLNGSTFLVTFSKATLGLRDSFEREYPEYVYKSRLACGMTASGDVRMNEGEKKISAHITIDVGEHLVKDCGGKDNNKDFWIDLEEYGWSKEPQTYWGHGFFRANSDWLDVYLLCTEKEFPILLNIITESLRRDGYCGIMLDIGHPNHMTSPDFGGHIEATDEYIDVLIDSGVPFYVRGWDISVELKAEDEDEDELS